MSLQAQLHRNFNSVVVKQASSGHFAKPVYSLNGRTHTHNGLKMEDDAGEDDEVDDEVMTKHASLMFYTFNHLM